MATQIQLVVLQPFASAGVNYARGDRISDPAAVATVEAGSNAHNVYQITVTSTASGTITPAPPATGTAPTTGTGTNLSAAQLAALAGEPVDAANILALQQRIAADELVLAALQAGGASSTSSSNFSSDFSSDFGGSATIRTSYPASGAISPSDVISILTNTSPAAMTLAAGTTDNRVHIVKSLGTASATLAAVIDGQQQTLLFSATTGSTRPCWSLRWLADLATYIVE